MQMKICVLYVLQHRQVLQLKVHQSYDAVQFGPSNRRMRHKETCILTLKPLTLKP